MLVVIGLTLAIFVILCVILNFLFFAPYKFSKWGKFYKETHDNYSDIAKHVKIKSGRHILNGYIYGNNNTKGLIIISHAMGVCSAYYIPEALYLINKGYKVLLFDNTGYWKNKELFMGVPQAIKDLKAAVYAIDDHKTPIILMGHSMGAYSVCSVLNYLKTDIACVISYSGFADYKSTIKYYVSRFIKILWQPLYFCIMTFQTFRFGFQKKNLALSGINSTKTNFFIIHGLNDKEIPLNSISIYANRNKITNQNCKYYVSIEPGFDTHMGVIHKDNTFPCEINTKILDNVIQYIESCM